MTGERIRAPCPECGPYRHVAVLAEEVVRVEDDFLGPDWSEEKYRIVACQGCGTRFFQTISTNSDDLVEARDTSGNGSGQAPRETKKYRPPFRWRKRKARTDTAGRASTPAGTSAAWGRLERCALEIQRSAADPVAGVELPARRVSCA